MSLLLVLFIVVEGGDDWEKSIYLYGDCILCFDLDDGDTNDVSYFPS